MTTERKVRANFDLTKEYSVDVSKCTEAEKKQVQQAFFDVGLRWSPKLTGEEYQFLGALQYTNTRSSGMVARSLLYAHSTEGCNMSPAEFLELVYEPEQQGHVHAELMAQYAEDAKTTDKPWELWELQHANRTEWITMKETQQFHSFSTYRRKPKTHTVNGVEVPDLRIEPNEGDYYWMPDVRTERLVHTTFYAPAAANDKHRVSNNLCYEYTEEGKQAAILHAKAWLGVAV